MLWDSRLCVLCTNETRFARSDIHMQSEWHFPLFLIKPIENGIICRIPKSNSVSGALRVKYRCGLIGIQPGIMNGVCGEFIVGLSIKSTSPARDDSFNLKLNKPVLIHRRCSTYERHFLSKPHLTLGEILIDEVSLSLWMSQSLLRMGVSLFQAIFYVFIWTIRKGRKTKWEQPDWDRLLIALSNFWKGKSYEVYSGKNN